MIASKKIWVIIPLIAFVCIFLTLWRGLTLQPTLVPSPLINTFAPTFNLPTLFDTKKFTSQRDFLGHITLVNIWASWCSTCAEEHDVLIKLAHSKGLQLYGINYKDDPLQAQKWLAKKGNPYNIIALDSTGDTSIDWGVYGTPETFIIDKRGMIRYKHVGPITTNILENDINNLLKQLQSENV